MPPLLLRLRGGRGSAPAAAVAAAHGFPPPTDDDTDYLTALPQCVITVILRLLPGRDLLAAKMAHRSLGAAMRHDPSTWEPAAMQSGGWRMRRDAGEGWEALFRRMHVGAGQQRIVSLGGCDENEYPTRTVDCYLLGSDEWVRAAPLRVPRDAPCAATDSESIFILGGWDCRRDKALRSAERASFDSFPLLADDPPPKPSPDPRRDDYDPDDDDPDADMAYPDDVYGDSDGDIVDEDDITESDLENADGESPWQEPRPSSVLYGPGLREGKSTVVWTAHPAMTQPRCFAAATCDEMKRLWVVGGGSSLYQGAETYGELEFLEAGATEWRRAGVMAEPRCGLALACDARASTLFLVGGYSGGLSYQKTVDAHDMRTGASHRLPDMRDHRSGPGAACGPDGCLYVVGGSPNGQRMLGSCERYDPREGTWHPLADLLTSRGYLSSTFALDGKLYTAGGCGKSFGDPVDAFEVYEPAADKWRALAPLRAPRSNLSLVLAL